MTQDIGKMMKKKIDIIIQSRIGSKRLPNKVLKKIKNFNITECLIKRLENTKYISDIIFAIPDNKENDKGELAGDDTPVGAPA